MHRACLRICHRNSIESHAVLQVLNEQGVPSVVLLHEFASYTGKQTAFPDAMRWASETVFSARLLEMLSITT